MRALSLIGIGTGNPEHLTLQAVAELARTDVVFALDKGSAKGELLDLRRELCERFIQGRPYRFVTAPDVTRRDSIDTYRERVDVWHGERAEIYEQLIERELEPGQRGAFLVWGDPSLYDSTLRILAQVEARARIAFELRVIPGISSPQALAASHRLVLNRVGGEVRVTTGRRLAQHGLAPDATDVVVMLDGECSFRQVEDPELEIFWGAYLGTPDEVLRAGPLAEVASEIEAARADARARKGWIMDTYLLRRSSRSRRSS